MQGKGDREEKPRKLKQVLPRGVTSLRFLVLQNREIRSGNFCKFCTFSLEPSHFCRDKLQPRVWRTLSAKVANEGWDVPSSWLSISGRALGHLLRGEAVPRCHPRSSCTPQQKCGNALLSKGLLSLRSGPSFPRP